MRGGRRERDGIAPTGFGRSLWPRAGFGNLLRPPGGKSEAAFGDDDALQDTAPAPAPGPAPAPAPAPAVPAITWNADGYSADNAAGASTTIETAFAPV